MPKAIMVLIFTLAALLALSVGVRADNAADAYLSPVEQEVLHELNMARTNPEHFAEFLSEMRPYFNGKQLERPGQVILVTQEGVAAVDEAIGFLRSKEPVSALEPSRGLSLAAQTHAEDQQNGAMGHTGSDGSQPWDRMNRYGIWHDRVAENISYGGYSARGVVIQLIVDDGVPGRGHRINLFNPQYQFVGIGCGGHARFHDMCVMDFAVRYSEQSKH
jgi:uncharacterized protein YkwD